MSLFGSIMNKILHRGGGGAGAPQAAAPAAAAPPPSASASAPAPAPAPVQPSSDTDVEAVLTEMASMKGGGGNWRTSIVDLLKLLDLDSSVTARKELAEELGVHAGEAGTAEQNTALSKAVWRKLAENGGVVPASLRD